MLNAELERKVEERTIKLNEAIRDLEAFAYSISHDLRAPVRHINGFVKMMYSNIPVPSESITGYFNKINEATKRMSSMIDSLLYFSRLGRKELSVSLTDLGQCAKEIIEEFKPDIEGRQIKWNISFLPQILCDKDLMKLVFENIISNAIKYTSKKKNAIITIGCKAIADEIIEVFVKDNGIGFDMAYADKLFGVFQRLHTSEEFEGIGIGLANARQIIIKHRGTIRAEGKLNKGAVFYITLPSK
jgi:light-regulated signal transduction histidine kinase (bacteriophytochrome)